VRRSTRATPSCGFATTRDRIRPPAEAHVVLAPGRFSAAGQTIGGSEVFVTP
jgi:hypothetical protein